MGARARGAAAVAAVVAVLSTAACTEQVPDAQEAEMARVVQAVLAERDAHVIVGPARAARPGTTDAQQRDLLARTTTALQSAEADVHRRLDAHHEFDRRHGVTYVDAATETEVTRSSPLGSRATATLVARSRYHLPDGNLALADGQQWQAGFVRRGDTWVLDTLEHVPDRLLGPAPHVPLTGSVEQERARLEEEARRLSAPPG